MNSKLYFVALSAIFIFSCGAPKVAVTAMQPNPVQVPPKIASVDEEKPVNDAFAEGKSLYENKCGNCHALFKTTDFSKEEWGPIVARMQIKAKIDNEQTAKIYNYITVGLN